MALKITDYSDHELMEMLELKKDKIYSEDDICIKYMQKVMNVQQDKDMEKEERESIIGFLNKVLSKLLSLNSVKKMDQIRTEKKIEKLPLLYGVGAPTLTRKAQMDERGELYRNMNSHRRVNTNTSENKIFKVPKLLAYDPEDNVQDIKNLKPDRVNNIKIRETSKLLKINSMFRADYYNSSSSDFMLTLPQTLTNITELKLNSLEMINNIYNISSKNRTNEFNVEVYDLSASDGLPLTVSNTEIINKQIVNVKIKDGNYTIEQLVNYLNRHVFSHGVLQRLCVEYDNENKKIVFQRDERDISNGGIPDQNNFAYRFNLDWRLSDNKSRPIQLNLGWKLGYRKNYYEYDNNYIIKDKVTTNLVQGYNPECGVDLNGSKYFMLSINDFNNNTGETVISPYQESLFNDTNVIAHIPWNDGSLVKFSSGEYVYEFTRQYFGPVDITRIHVRLLDEYGRIVDLNNNDFSFSLVFTQAYNHDHGKD